jgi:hypothetical protein
MTAVQARRLLLMGALGALVPGLAACPGGPEPSPDAALGPSLLPADYRQRFVEVRDCRSSVEHLGFIVIKTEPGVVAAYNQGPYPLAAGTLIIKEEFSDRGCQVPTGWTLMQKQAAGYDDRWGDWLWQRLDATGRVLEDGKVARCGSCHALPACRARDFACAEP